MQTNFYTPLKYNVITQPACSYTIIFYLEVFHFHFLARIFFLYVSSATVAVLDVVSEASYDKITSINYYIYCPPHATTNALEEPVKWLIEPKSAFAAPKCLTLYTPETADCGILHSMVA